MSAQIAEVTAGTLTFKLSGMLKWPEMAEVQRQTTEIIQQHGGKVRFLVIMEDILGMEKDEN